MISTIGHRVAYSHAAILLALGLLAAADANSSELETGNSHPSFLIDFILAQSQEECGKGPWFGGEVGQMWKMGPDVGLGGKLFVGGDDCGERYGFRIVGRRWISRELSFEVGPGIVFGGNDGQSYPALSFQLALDVAGVVAPVYSLEMIRPPSGRTWAPGMEPRTRWESHLGVRFSSYLAPLVALGLGILAGASI